MNILIVNFEYPPLGGGGGVATQQIARELSTRNQVTVLTTAFVGLPRQEKDEGVHVVRVPVLGRYSRPTASLLSMVTFIPTACWKIFRLCQQQKFDVINAQFVIPSGIPAALAARLFRIPLVISFIGGDIYDPTKGVSPHRHWWLRALIRLISRQAAVCTAISEDTKFRAQQLHGVRQEIVVTHLGLLPQESLLATRQEYGLPAHDLLAISIGRLIPRKSYDVLLQAWRGVSGACLIIIGDGPLEEKLKKLTKEYGLQERVKFMGFTSDEDKIKLLGLSDLYVSAAQHEGFGIVFLEAMEAGLPIVAMNEGGQTDFLVEGQNALLVPPENVDGLQAALNRLVADNTLRQRMSENNKQKVKDFYMSTTVATFEKVLKRAAAL